MRGPLRFRQFAVAYIATAAIVALIPSTTIDGVGPAVGVRRAIAADPLDLAFEAPGLEPVNATGQKSSNQVPVRRSATPMVAGVADTSPVRVSIPRLGIEGAVVPVGIGPDRQLDVPLPQTAGWYEHSSAPLQDGASVIAAHVDFGGEPGLFFDLRLIELGDLVYVDTPDGTEQAYRVTEVVLYDKSDLPAEDLFRSSGPHALHLVTCGGSFDRFARSYRGNQVVTAVPV